MKRLLPGLGGVLAAVVVGVTGAQADPARTIRNPDWVQKPTGDDMERFYPSKAKEQFVSGRAVITCDVDADGRLIGCVVMRESPEGYGFGDAALSLSPMFRMSPKLIDGKPVDGGVVTVPIIFEAASEQPEIGDEAMVLTRVGTQPPVVAAPVETSDDDKAPTIPCPDDVGMCQGHYFMWDERPTVKQNTRLIDAAKPAQGLTFAVCTITTEGLLDGCLFSGDLTPGTEKAMRESVSLFRAPYKTADGLATASATVIIPFMWNWLTGREVTQDIP